MSGVTSAAWLCIVAPLVGSALTPILHRLGPRARDIGAVAFSGIGAAAAVSLLPALVHPEALPVEHEVTWLARPLYIGVGVMVDPLSIVLANVVAVISFIIMVYCVGYMKGDPGQTRFWMWMNGFIGSMLLLVFASNLLFLFIGWKLVGVCSYGLIGFYHQDQRKHWIGGPPPTPFVKPSEACTKALVVTGVGDMLMLGGILLLYFYAGTLNFLELYATAPTWLAAMAATPAMIILVSLLLLAGPLGKSAQFPFHEWLPEAMAGPGPVSALIHAATMVKSGVYLVARLVPLFYYGYWVADIEAAGWFFHLTAWLGAFTAFLAATQGAVALELKKVLAYSTVSQIGYMLLGLGAAGLAPGLLLDGYTAGIFHLVSHALFKACLFLCAGTVIHAVHSIYISEMGGVRKHLRLTWVFTWVASLSLMGVPFLSGFWSKDAVLLATAQASTPLLLLGLITAGITAFYTVRFVGLVFHGAASPEFTDTLRSAAHVDDGYLSMRVASGLLAAGIVLASLAGLSLEHVLRHGFETGLAGDLAAIHSGALALPSATSSDAGGHLLVPVLSVLFVACGALPAYRLYVSGRSSPGALLDRYPQLERIRGFLWNRWGIDALYTRLFVDGTAGVATFVADGLERRFNTAVHETLPQSFTRRSQRLVQRLRADTEELLFNVSYVLILFVVLLTYLFVGADGS